MKTPRQVDEHLGMLVAGWEEYAPDASFSGLSLAQFKQKIKPSLDARASIDELNLKLKISRAERENADAVSVEIANAVVNAVKGDANFGENSALYASFGYIRKADRKSGLTRASKSGSQSEFKVAA